MTAPDVPIRVLVVDDQLMVRSAIAAMLHASDHIEIVGEAGDGEQAIAAAFEHRPDVVLMDVRMPGMTGVEATRHILTGWPHADTPRPRILMLTTFDLDEYVHATLRAGAAGFILKNSSADRLTEAITVVAGGEAMLAPSVTQRLIQTFSSLPPRLLSTAATTPPHLQRLHVLTEQERTVAHLVARGLSNRQIARRLGLSEASVKSTLNRILTRLGLENRVQVALAVHDLGDEGAP